MKFQKIVFKQLPRVTRSPLNCQDKASLQRLLSLAEPHKFQKKNTNFFRGSAARCLPRQLPEDQMNLLKKSMDEKIINYKEIINKIKPETDKVINFLEREMAKIRTSRANPALVEDVVVECFGQKFPLKQLAAISVPEPREILIQPWDKSYVQGITLALEKTGIGSNPIVDKDVIRINLPLLTEEYRKNLLRALSNKQEEARKTIRRWREEAWREIQDGEKLGKIREDDKFRAKDELQKLIDDYNEKIEKIGESKKKEISE